MNILQIGELLSQLVTILGLPFAIFLFAFQQRKERENEEEEIYELLATSYTDFLKLVIANPDLKLRSDQTTPDLDEEQQDRLFAMLEILISLFERAYLLTYDERMTGKKLRRWLSWEDSMKECAGGTIFAHACLNCSSVKTRTLQRTSVGWRNAKVTSGVRLNGAQPEGAVTGSSS